MLGRSCGVSGSLHCNMWDLRSLPGIEPVSPPLGSRFLTTGLPGKSLRQGIILKA